MNTDGSNKVTIESVKQMAWSPDSSKFAYWKITPDDPEV